VFDGYVPAALPNGDLFFVNPPPGTYIFGKSGPEIHVSHISAGNNSAGQTQDLPLASALPLLDNVDLSSIHVLRSSHVFTPAPWAQPVISARETPLLIAGEYNNRRVAALSFDLHDSDLPLQPSFPILIYNLVNWFLPPPVAGNGQVSPNLAVTVQAWPGADRVTITGPNQQPVTVAPPFPAAPFTQTNTIGIYQVIQFVHGQQRQGAFTVNLFDPSQSRLTPANTLPVVHSSDFVAGNNAVPQVLREIWPEIAALLLLILCVEWWLFSRSYHQRNMAVMRNKGSHKGSPIGINQTKHRRKAIVERSTRRGGHPVWGTGNGADVEDPVWGTGKGPLWAPVGGAFQWLIRSLTRRQSKGKSNGNI